MAPKFEAIESKATILSHTKDELLKNVRYACTLMLPEVDTQARPNKDTWVICAGGPSLKESFEELRTRQAKGEKIVSVGATYDVLCDQGVTPDYYILLDASKAIATFFEPRVGTEYLVASQCDKVVFDKLIWKDYKVSLWHPLDTYGSESVIREYGIKSTLVPGGSTTALRALELGYRMGVRVFHYYGIDSSADKDLYAYELKPGNRDNEEDKVIYPVYMFCSNGFTVEFFTTVDLACQASEFMILCRKYAKLFYRKKHPCIIEVHGKGLVPAAWNTYMKMYKKDRTSDVNITIKAGMWDKYRAPEDTDNKELVNNA